MSRALITALLFVNIALFIGRANSSSATAPQTKNYIDTISGYDELSACAVRVLSTVVRDENSGCQDTYALTSYTCFCTDSSSYFSNVISRDVVAGCDSSIAAPQATSALGVFDAYCALGVVAGVITSQTSAPTDAGSASPASSVSTTSPAQTSSTAAAVSPQGRSSDLATAIGAGVGVAVGVIALALVTWLVWRSRHRKAKAERAQLSQSQQINGAGLLHQGGIKVGNSTEMPTYEHHVQEMQDREPAEIAQGPEREAPVVYRPHELSGSYPPERGDG